MNKIGVIRIRSDINAKKEVKSTLSMLKLYNKNTCIVLDNTKPILGMLNRIKDYITWGELEKGTLIDLLKVRGRLAGKKRLTEEYLKEKIGLNIDSLSDELIRGSKKLKDIPGLKTFFKLKAPEGGFERGGVKKPFSMGGVLGYRKEKINELIKKML